MEQALLISDAAKAVQVESHVLRYWEEELALPIRRNEQGHRYYTEEDVERFRQIKKMKEGGLQLKAIKVILRDGRFDVLSGAEPAGEAAAVDTVPAAGAVNESAPEDREERAKRLQWVMQQMVRQAILDSRAELAEEIGAKIGQCLKAELEQQLKESLLKELDYQFRMQEEREEERARLAMERTEFYYRRVDELICKKSGRKKLAASAEKRGDRKKAARPDKQQNAGVNYALLKDAELQAGDGAQKKKRHFFS
ncbi:MAG: MerR family transcriptional regulator [Lachnospiraceae bacterium]|nr:MerR family transcriptional regulator [Lachnospiraceae bacterium]